MTRLVPITRPGRFRPLLAALLCAVLLLALAAPPAGAAAKPGIALPPKQVEALLELRHPRGLNAFVRRVSDPRSASYRRYATVEQLTARYGARPSVRHRVMRWLSARGLRGRVTAGGGFVLATLDAGRAARLLPRAGTATATARAGVGVPAALRGAVERIALLSTAPRAEKLAGPLLPDPAAAAALARNEERHNRAYYSPLRQTGTASGCAAGTSEVSLPGFVPFAPNQYLTAYGHAAMHARGLKGQGQTVAVVETGGFKRSDVVTFARCFGLGTPPPTRVVPVGVGKPLPGELETTLDVSMLAAGAPKLKKIYVYEGGESEGDAIETAAAALGSPGHRPDVISISLGFCEPGLHNAVVLRDAIDNIFAVAGGAGISVLVSAGDQGSSGCRVKNLETEQTTALPVLAVSLPASSAYATAVGGTELALTPKNRINREIVWNDWPLTPWGGGGGLSLLYAHAPWWQRTGHAYGLGRKVPDIAALADLLPGYGLYCSAASCEPQNNVVPGWSAVGGTSAAAPLMAAGVALADQYAARHGQRSLGFLNPLLYRLGADGRTRRSAFHDVTYGNDDIGRALPIQAQGGIPLGCCRARRGYDMASGWGSLKIPGFTRLAAGAAG
ncbi:MAG: S53 family peptidase [Solirubrobacterales bacterium]